MSLWTAQSRNILPYPDTLSTWRTFWIRALMAKPADVWSTDMKLSQRLDITRLKFTQHLPLLNTRQYSSTAGPDRTVEWHIHVHVHDELHTYIGVIHHSHSSESGRRSKPFSVLPHVRLFCGQFHASLVLGIGAECHQTVWPSMWLQIHRMQELQFNDTLLLSECML